MSIYKNFLISIIGGVTISLLKKITRPFLHQSKEDSAYIMDDPGADGDIDVFISYSSRDRPRVLEIARALEKSGVSCWLDFKFIDGGDVYGPEIVNAIKKSKVLALMCSANSMRSPHVKQEVILAMEFNKKYLPLLLDDHLLKINGYPEQIQYWLAGNQWIEVLSYPEERWLPRVLRSLQKGGIGLNIPQSVKPSVPDAPAPIPTNSTIYGLLSIAGYTDQFWPTTPDEAKKLRGQDRGAGARACRDVAAPQDGVDRQFRIGDHLNIVLECKTGGYLTLLDFGTTGTVYSVCPSRFVPGQKIIPGKHVFPSGDSPHPTFVASGRPGTEQLLAIITDEPLDLDWMPEDPKMPAKVLDASELDNLLGQVMKREANEWAAYATYFAISG